MANNLLYTPFGYYLRVMVPKDLRDALGKREIKKSLTTLNLSCAIKAAQLLMPEISIYSLHCGVERCLEVRVPYFLD